MSWLFENFWFEPGSRMTGVWLWPWSGNRDTRGDVVLFSLVGLGEGQDGSLECDFLSSHLPWAFGGIHGVGPDGSPWLLVAQIAPETARDAVESRNPWWPLVDSLDRALHFNAEATLNADHGLTLAQILDIYYAKAIPPLFVDDWSIAELVNGLLAECTGIPLESIVTGRITGCSLNDVPHDCQKDTFHDAFTAWKAGLVTVGEAPESNPDAPPGSEDDSKGHGSQSSTSMARRGGQRPSWAKSHLRSWSKKKLRRQAIAEGMKPRTAKSSGRKALTRFLAGDHPAGATSPRSPS